MLGNGTTRAKPPPRFHPFAVSLAERRCLIRALNHRSGDTAAAHMKQIKGSCLSREQRQRFHSFYSAVWNVQRSERGPASCKDSVAPVRPTDGHKPAFRSGTAEPGTRHTHRPPRGLPSPCKPSETRSDAQALCSRTDATRALLHRAALLSMNPGLSLQERLASVPQISG
ncbi:hypothetical protein AAFF_G00360550 [Aldrovandia affinis]|uniref:Uncharacterized protein n=1 Tax=Aldrovandia affinis TaxID=143900 RepID=A0AAD7WP35_9TELE|nr:hypothetical protein AAFF_G00360550 [Aldrovandia affinis]